MSSSVTHYSILQVTRGASTEQVTKAYRKLALECHPDRNTSADAVAKFQRLQEAYDTLKDAHKRNLYNIELQRRESVAAAASSSASYFSIPRMSNMMFSSLWGSAAPAAASPTTHTRRPVPQRTKPPQAPPPPQAPSITLSKPSIARTHQQQYSREYLRLEEMRRQRSAQAQRKADLNNLPDHVGAELLRSGFNGFMPQSTVRTSPSLVFADCLNPTRSYRSVDAEVAASFSTFPPAMSTPFEQHDGFISPSDTAAAAAAAVAVPLPDSPSEKKTSAPKRQKTTSEEPIANQEDPLANTEVFSDASVR